jgi:hypothetical protein
MVTTVGAQAVKQLRLPKCGGRREDKHPRAYLYRTMGMLEQVEDRALTVAEDEDTEDWETADAELNRCIAQAVSFYQQVIAPVYRDWWM